MAKQIALINFIDTDENVEGIAIVEISSSGHNIGLTLALNTVSDTEIYMTTEVCEELVKALQSAIQLAKSEVNPG